MIHILIEIKDLHQHPWIFEFIIKEKENARSAALLDYSPFVHLSYPIGNGTTKPV
jgi:hypothetical protein